MDDICYSPRPHEHYVTDGVGPGAAFLGDTQMWNWRWLRVGEAANVAADSAIIGHFNSALRGVMMKPPAEAYLWMQEHLPSIFSEVMQERLIDAQARLYPPVIAKRDGNLIFANFGRRTA